MEITAEPPMEITAEPPMEITAEPPMEITAEPPPEVDREPEDEILAATLTDEDSEPAIAQSAADDITGRMQTAEPSVPPQNAPARGKTHGAGASRARSPSLDDDFEDEPTRTRGGIN